MTRLTGVVLDGYATNPGDLSWAALEALVDLTVWPRSAPGVEVAARVREADVAFLNKAVLDAAAIESAPRLKFVGILATGYNTIDLAAARARGIVVCNVPGYATMAVAQQTWALLLELTNAAGTHARDVAAGGWSRNPDYCYWLSPQVELAGRTLGIVGYGAIGQAVARIATAFGMSVLAYRRHPAGDPGPGVRWASLDEVFAASDVVSLHCPLTPETAHLADVARLGTMKPGAFLLNTSRGGVIDEAAVAAALRAGQLAGFGADVLSAEPPPPDNPLLSAPHVVLSPHLAWATRAARIRLIDEAAANLRAWLDGTPRNQVS
ncbi:MAG: D-2-hydroxyacid dehydrogenase [Kiritimatiellae bacterium]|nr:D-2-hydroxyacid dehydrogenase [Kiritimatiellia bacterium]MBQ9345664.1 D-2-hydroxyacid dehydrogenase [Kiritimatiellia bacterium]